MRAFVVFILIFTFSCKNDYLKESKQKTHLNDTPTAFAKTIVEAFNNKDFSEFYSHFITEEDYDYIISKTHFNTTFSEKLAKSTKPEAIASNYENSKTYFFNSHFKNLKYQSIDYRLVRDQGGLLFTRDLEVSALDQGEQVKIIFQKLVKIEDTWKSASLFMVE